MAHTRPISTKKAREGGAISGIREHAMTAKDSSQDVGLKLGQKAKRKKGHAWKKKKSANRDRATGSERQAGVRCQRGAWESEQSPEARLKPMTSVQLARGTLFRFPRGTSVMKIS